MRYGQFKLNEDEIKALRPVQPVASGPKITDAEVEDDLDNIETVAANAKEQDPSYYKKIQNSLLKLTQKAKKLLAKQDQEPAVEEDAALAIDDPVAQSIEMLRKIIARLCQGKPIEVCQNPDAMEMAQEVATLEGKLDDRYKQERQAGKDEEQQEFKDFYNSLSGILQKLGKKAQGHTDLTDEMLSAMDSKKKSSAKKVQLNAEKFATELGNSLESLFLEALLTPEGQKLGITRDDITDFLTHALDGTVIDNARMVSQDKGKIDDFVNSEYKKVYDAIAGRLIPLKPPASGGANIGPGELALAMLGNPSAKAKKGDIDIDGTIYEIKAGAGSIGGRFNSDEVTTAFAGWNTFDRELKNIAGDELVTRGKSEKTGKPVSLYNWNDKGISALNTQVLAPLNNKKATVQFLTNTFRKIVKNHEEVDIFDQAIDSMVKDDGTINEETYMKLYSRILYESYSKADGISNIMIIDTAAREYVIIRSGKDLSKKLGSEVRSSGGFNWNDNHQKASPQYVISR
tara:strand:+ start:4442 stop:5986 length:1545 start_codon:yes stop_codon:yes gene_type:complete